MSAAPYAGISLALLATTAYNVGLIQEKRALGRMPALDMRRVPRVIGNLLADPAWLAGFALMLLGLACQTIVLTFEPVSVVQPVLASGVALVLVLSRLVLRERLGAMELRCVAAMAVCVILLAASGGGKGTGAGHHASPGWMAGIAIPSAVIGLLVAASPLRSRSLADRAPNAALFFGAGTGLLYGVAALAIKALSGILVHNHGAASIVTGIVSSPYLYVFAGSSAAAMLLYQVGLQSCRASILVPVSTVTGSAYFLIVGTWLFREHLPADPAKLVLRLAAIAVAGLVIITLSRRGSAEASRRGSAEASRQGSAEASRQGSAEAEPSPATVLGRQLWLWRTRCSTSWYAPSTNAACCTSPTTRRCTTRGCAGCTGSRMASR
jgi:Magnesium transporter NIPA